MAQYKEEVRMAVEGLWTSPNPLSETTVPPGALIVAENINIRQKSKARTRRGFKQFGDSLSQSIKSIYQYRDRLLNWQDDGTFSYDSTGFGDWIAYSGIYNVPDATVVGSRIRSFESNKNFYFLTEEGVQVLDSLSSTPVPAGVPAALGGTGETTGSTGWMADDTAVAYRIVWGYKDLNNNLKLSEASDRIIVINDTGSTANTEITFTVPFGDQITVNYFYQLYRSDASATAADVPSDNYQQVFESNPTNGELAARSVTVTDILPDGLRGAFLYSSFSQEGALQVNSPPPYCKDACLFKNYAFYANTREPHTFNLTLLSVISPLGLQVGDTITFTSGVITFTLTGAVSQDTSIGNFLVYTSGTPEQNNEITARSIISVINLYSANTLVDGYYISGYGELPGKMNFTKRTFDSINFRVNSNRTTCWDKVIPVTGETTINISNNNVFLHRVYVSKIMQPDAVPFVQFYDFGSASKEIMRIVPLRDAIIIFKEDGIFSISGNSLDQFRSNTLDNTAISIAPNSIVALSNGVYYMSQQGVAVITNDSSPIIVSSSIETDLLAISSPSVYPNFAELSFAVGYESEREYTLSTVSAPSDIVCTKQYTYNTFTKTWVTANRENYCGIINSDDNKLYYGGKRLSSMQSYVYQERKTQTERDYADEEYVKNITGVSGLTLTLDNLDNIVVDMALEQELISAVIVSIDTDNSTITVDSLDDWVIDSATFYSPITSRVKTNPIAGKHPELTKQVADIQFFFQLATFDSITANFNSNYIPNGSTVTLIPVLDGSFGELPFGEGNFGGNVADVSKIMTWVPKAVQRCSWLNVELSTTSAFRPFIFLGVAIFFNYNSPRQRN